MRKAVAWKSLPVFFVVLLFGGIGCTLPVERFYLGEFNGTPLYLERIAPSWNPELCQAFSYIMNDDVRSLEKLIDRKGVSPKAILENYSNLSLFNVALVARSKECAWFLYRRGGNNNSDDPLQTWLTLKLLVTIDDEVFQDFILTDLELNDVDFDMLSPFGTKLTLIEDLQQHRDKFKEEGNTVMVENMDSYISQLKRRISESREESLH